MMSSFQLLNHAVLPAPDLIADAVAHGFFLKVRHVRTASEKNHVRKEDRRLAQCVPVLGEQCADRFAFFENREQSRFRPVFYHVISLPDKQRRPRLLCDDEAGEGFHHRRLASAGARAEKDLCCFVIRDGKENVVHPRRDGAVKAARAVAVRKAHMRLGPVENCPVVGEFDALGCACAFRSAHFIPNIDFSASTLPFG